MSALAYERKRLANSVVIQWIGLALVAAGLFLAGVDLGVRVAAPTTPPETTAASK